MISESEPDNMRAQNTTNILYGLKWHLAKVSSVKTWFLENKKETKVSLFETFWTFLNLWRLFWIWAPLLLFRCATLIQSNVIDVADHFSLWHGRQPWQLPPLLQSLWTQRSTNSPPFSIGGKGSQGSSKVSLWDASSSQQVLIYPSV